MDWVKSGSGEHPLARIAVNGRFEGRRATGVDRYASEITGRLDGSVRIVRPRTNLRGARGHLWEQFSLPACVGVDEVLWSPANSGPIGVRRQVITIHDLSVLEHPEWFSSEFALWYRMMLPALAKRARHILTVSEHSRASIMRRLGVPARKVTAIPNGVNRQMFRPTNADGVRRKYGLAVRYVLFVGSIDPRKNLPRLIKAWNRNFRGDDCELVIAGTRTGVFRAVHSGEAGANIRLLGYVPDEDLPALYTGAEFFVMPSLFEGFGLTVLEAMACGTPVISSTGGALPEVADGAALLVDPSSVDEMATAMCTLHADECLQEALRAKGIERAREFTWERSAMGIHEVLEQNA